ncbi:MAG: V-type ATPase subunit [Acutalibacteraceae bacterium]|nr:V-type ATPase subunit [Acutalibacteraceae bacterium]
MALSYEFSIGSVRARENSLFSEADAEQMLALRSEGDLVRYLKDKGYGDGDTIDAIMESNTRRMWAYIKSIAPDFNLFLPFFIQNDIHNLKTVLKGTMADREYEALLIEPCSIPKEALIKAVENRRFEQFPQWLQRPANRAYQILAETKDARLSDAYLDRGVLDELLAQAKRSRSPFLMAYFNTMVFYTDVKTALRGARVNASRYYLEKAIVECEGLDKAAVVKAALQGSEALIKYLKAQQVYDCHKAIELFVSSPSAFEKFVDNRLIGLAKQLCRLSSEGPEPLLGYYIGCVYERKMITLIASGLTTETPKEQIRERLREIYG